MVIYKHKPYILEAVKVHWSAYDAQYINILETIT